MRRRRMVFRDPEPLPAGAPEFQDEQARQFYLKEQANALLKMAHFDNSSGHVRQVDHVVGNLEVAQNLVRQGVTSARIAEPIVRQMLESRQQGRRKL